MAEFVKLNYICNNFYKLTKEAGLTENMAKRIFFSLLQHLIPEQERATRLATTGNAIDYKALESLVHGAKEVVKYGAKACEDECDHYQGEKENNFSKNDIGYNLRMAVNLFNDDGLVELEDGGTYDESNPWEPQYGGESWAQIAKTLLNVNNYLTKAEKEKASYDWEEYHKTLMEMAVELNFLDQLMHNTGSIFNKMLDLEFKDNVYNEKDDKNNRKRKKDIRRLMHSKELIDPYHALSEVLPHVEKDPGNFRSWVIPAKNTLEKQFTKYTKEDINEQIVLIKLRKELEALYKKYDLKNIKINLMKKDLNNFGIEYHTNVLRNIYNVVDFVKINYDYLREFDGAINIIKDTTLQSATTKDIIFIISQFESLIDKIYK